MGIHTNAKDFEEAMPFLHRSELLDPNSSEIFASTPARPTPLAGLVDALQQVELLQGLTQVELEWLATHGRERMGADRCIVFQENEPAHFLTIVLKGDIHVHRRKAGAITLFVGRTAQITGKLPYSRMETWRGDGCSSGSLWILEIHDARFAAMLLAIPSMTQRCVSILLDRVRDFTRADLQTEKLVALGKLAANISHELNNPASAAQRAGGDLIPTINKFESLCRLGRVFKSEAELSLFIEWVRVVAQSNPSASTDLSRSATVAVDLESEILDWLEKFDVPMAWNFAAVLAEANISMSALNELPTMLEPIYVPAAIEAVCAFIAVGRGALTVSETTKRIFEIVTAVKDYSYMDRAQLHRVDLALSVDNALALLRPELENIVAQREYDPGIPLISAYGAELSQVWTALLENAIYAMQGKGSLRIRICLKGHLACVEVWDNGSGIDLSVASRVFEPFFTTKPIGQGLGLGLDLVRRIVDKHFGSVTLQALPRCTCFEVRLPIDSPHFF